MKINENLKKYIEEDVFPEYSKNEPAHNIEHIKYVINRSFKFADTVPNINYDMVYTIAAYHDIGHHIDPKKHEIISGEIMSKDEKAEKDIYLEKGLIKTSEKEGFYNRCIKYKSEIIENIQNTYNLNYFHALEVWTSVLQNWKNSLKG